MCNLYSQTRAPEAIRQLFMERGMAVLFPEGVPNLEPRDICITDPAPIVRAGRGGYELVVRRWSWPGPNGKPVYNFRSDGREFASGRCLVVADGFYEFTARADPASRRKDRWLFSDPEGDMLGIAGLLRDPESLDREAFTILTCPPGEDVAPYHGRQVAVLPAQDWRKWLDGSVPAAELIRPLPAGTLKVTAANRD